MRSLAIVLGLVTTAAAIVALSATATGEDAAPTGTAPGTPATGATAIVQHAGKAALVVALPTGWTAIPDGDDMVLKSPTGAPHVELSPTDATTVDAAVAGVAKLIDDYVTAFTVTATADTTVAGAPAKTLTGTGEEADDGDPSNAQVTFFALGGTVWALTAHGEGDGVAKAGATLASLIAGIAAAP